MKILQIYNTMGGKTREARKKKGAGEQWKKLRIINNNNTL